MKSWLQVRRYLGHKPIVEGLVGGPTPLYTERYHFRDIERSVPGVPGMVLLTQFGGAAVQEGEVDHWRIKSLPTRSMLVPAGCPTHWHYSGGVDFAAFYFPDHSEGITERFRLLAKTGQGPRQFSDALVGAAALEIVTELQKGGATDEPFLVTLATVMLGQTYRALTTPETGGISPNHSHFARIQGVLNHIRENLAQDLSVQRLANLARVSEVHFRRVFHDSLGAPPHRYILAARLEQARKLLTMTALPISQIAQDCGFSSQSHLTTSFKAAHAATPREFRAQIKRES
ncbi:MAG: AraC family transcriptional regulator [Sinimarinibacterium sp.]|jgi:AraC family transcriptional regulator